MSHAYRVPWTQRGHVFRHEREYVPYAIFFGALGSFLAMMAGLALVVGVVGGGWLIALTVPAVVIIAMGLRWVSVSYLGIALFVALISIAACITAWWSGIRTGWPFAILLLPPQFVLIAFGGRIPALRPLAEVTMDAPLSHHSGHIVSPSVAAGRPDPLASAEKP